MSHRQCPWCARSPPRVSGSQVKGMMDTAPRRRDDTQPHLTCFHMRAAVSGGGGGGGGRAQQVFFFTFRSCRRAAAAYFYAAHRSATDLRLDKWRWQERVICSNITSASCASTTALLSLKSGANTLSQAGESHSAWLKVCTLILMKNRAKCCTSSLFFLFQFPSLFCCCFWGWCDRFTFIHKVQSCSCIRQRVTRLFRLSCTSPISTLALLLVKGDRCDRQKCLLFPDFKPNIHWQF